MDRKQLCVANVRYKRPSADESRQNRNLLGYLTYRESRDQGAKLVAGQERWTDHGMGGSVAAIARRCEDLRSDHVLTFSLVVNPNPVLVALIPAAERDGFVRELTERTVEDFFEARGIDTGCEYSYVIHHRESDDPQAPGQHNPHAHVVLPGTVWTEESGARVPLYFSRNKKVNHIEMLHEVTEQNMVDMLDRYVGLDWEERIDRVLEQRAAQRMVVTGPPHGYHITEAGERIAFWGGARQIDETACAVGYYLPLADADGETRIVFRPVAQGLATQQAERVSAWVSSGLGDYSEIDQLTLYRETVKLVLDDDDLQRELAADHEPAHPAPDLEL